MSNFWTKLKISANRKTCKWPGLPVALPARGLWLASPLLLLFVLLLGVASPAQAGTDMCSFYKKNLTDTVSIVDGNDPFVRANLPGSSFGIDMNCEFRNFPISSAWPNGLTPTLNFYTPDKTSIYLIAFDNVWFSGNMACANIDHKLWVVNSEEGAFSGACQDLMIPAETIAKKSPAATATIGLPFTYTLTLPSMNFRAGDPSPNDLGTITVVDDLAAVVADLTLVSLSAHVKDSTTAVAITSLPDSTSKYLHFMLPNIAAGSQVVVEVTALLNDTPVNVPGMQFINTARWSFSRWIDLNEDGIQDANEYFNPLPGESGISTPMTIVAPNLVVNKTSTATALNLGDTAGFTIDVQNNGGGDAWNATIIDTLPAGMCAADPTASLSARIVQADGVTLVKNLIPGTDFSVAYNSCQLNLAMSDAAGPNAPDQHLLITYQAQLDPGFTNDGATLTNVAGATQWFSAKSTYAGRRVFARTLSDGTPAIIDHQDSQTVTAALHGYYFEKTVANLTSQASPAITAAPGDRLRYTLRLFNVDQVINGIIISDLLDPNSFDLTSFSNMTLPAGTTHTFNAATGQLAISGSPTPLNIALGDELVFAFDINLKPTLSNGSVVLNQASLAAAGNFAVLSDDPYSNGVASPDVIGDEDPTTVLIQSPGPLAKANTQPSATIGEHFTYRLTVPAIPTGVPLYDVRILDNLNASAADLRFVSARVAGGAWLANTSGSDSNLVIEDTITGIDIPANGQVIIEVTVELLNTASNRSGLAFTNSAAYTYNRVNGVASTQMNGGAGATANMTVVEPTVIAASKTVRFVTPAGKPASEPARVGDVLEYTVTIPNNGGSTAFTTNVADILPANLVLLPNSASAQVNGVPVTGFIANPTTLPSGALVWGRQNGDDTLDIPTGQSLVLTYQVTVVAVTGAEIINRVYVDWTSLPGGDVGERTGAGCPAVDTLNDYCSGPATVTLSTVDNTFISKAVVGDSYAETPASAGASIVRVGDTVTYELTLHLQEYMTQNVVVMDVLPAGMALESFAINAGPNFTYTLTAPPLAGSTGTLRWQFGDISNPPSNNATPLDPLVIRYVAQVISAAPPLGVAYDPSLLRDNRATLAYTGGDPALFPARLTATARIDVRQPQMRALRKVDLGNARVGTGTLADPYRVNIAAEVMNFQLSSCNDGLAPAYGVALSDLLAPEFDEGDLLANPPLVKINATTLVTGTGYSYTAPGRGGEMRVALADSAPLNPGACVTVDYSLGFHSDLTVSKSWSNQARLAEYRSLPLATGRLYPATAPAEVWMTNLVSVDQLLVTLLSPAEVTIGEEVVYQIRVPAVPMNASLNNVVVTDSLHGALQYLSASAVDANANPVALAESVVAGQVRLTIAAIPAGEQAVITLRTRVANNDSANAGTKFANTAAYTYNNMPVDAVTASTSGPLTIVEPLVTVTRTASTPSPQAGDLLTYTLNLTAAGAGTGDNFVGAFDLSIEENLGLGFAYLPGSATVNGAALADPLRNGGDGVTAPQILSWDPANGIDLDMAEGATISISYQLRVLAGVRPGQSLTSSASARWTGLNGGNALERTGSGTPLLNDYFTAPVNLTLSTPLAISFVKSVVNVTTGENPGMQAQPGDTLRYTLVFTNASVVPVTSAMVVDELATHFLPGSLQILSVSDANADRSNSSASGGANATGIVDIRNLTLAAQGNSNDTVTIEFAATLAPVLPSNTTVLNRAQLTATSLPATASNETATLISSAPQLRVLKSSQDLTGDSNVLRAGDTLRYTITVQNIGNEDATGVTLRDLIPAFTSYVANSTTLNGAVVADPAAGRSALNSGLLINAPAAATPGGMPADATGAAANTATITCDVLINSDVLDATLIVNQGFVSAAGVGSGPLADQPSDDPVTPVLDDPTRDIVGSLPLLDATKTVTLIDQGTAVNSVDPGDELLYTITITITNSGAIAASGVLLTDAMPARTTYVANSTQLNGVAVPDLVAGVAALPAGLPIQADGSPSGIIPPGASVTLTFKVRIDAVNVAPGDVISNQGYLASSELTTEPTDADGIDANGDQPTIIVVGSAQQLAIVKEVFVVGGGVALAGGQLEYVVRVTNNGVVAATDVLIVDDLTPLSGLANFIAGSATLGGAANPLAITYSAPLLTATVGSLPPGGAATLRFRVQINANVAIATTLTNSAQARWNTPAVTSPWTSVSLEIGGIPGSAMLNGHLWHDTNLDNLPAANEMNLAGWTVGLYRNNVALGSASTDAAGLYHFSGLAPSVTAGDQYELRFSAAGAGANTAKLGRTHSQFTNGLQQISGIIAPSGSNLQNLNLPISPNGVVYDSVVRRAVAGARVMLLNAATNAPLPGSCFDDPAQQNQLTLAAGYYKFDLNFSDPSCPPGSAYRIEIVPPASGYVTPPSRIIPPTDEETQEPFSVSGCSVSLLDAVPATAGYCEAVPTAALPPLAVAARSSGTTYYLHLALRAAALPGAGQLFNNHIPVDPILDGAVAISKISALRNVSKGQLVPYTITVTNVFGVPLSDLGIVDRFPAGFKYVEGSARLDGQPREPVINGRELLWDAIDLQFNAKRVLQLLLVVGAGVSEGEYVNRAQVISTVSGGAASGEATATVRVIPDPTFDCTDVVGKVFDDRDLDGEQDADEAGLAGVRVVSARGLIASSDAHGRFHMACAVVPDELRGSNFILKLDDRTLPTGYRVTSENPLVQRATRGKMLRYNFGATIHRVVAFDIADAVFEPDRTGLRLQWNYKLPQLLTELKKAPAVLRLSYLADVEEERLVRARLEALKEEIVKGWTLAAGGYRLQIETEVFWRRGGPP